MIESLSPSPYPNIPKCIRHFTTGDEGNYYLVLEDLSASHQSYEAIDFNRLESWEVALSALAAFHQQFTGRLTMDQIRVHADGPGEVEGYIQKLESAFRQFEADHRSQVREPVLDLMARSIPLIRAFELEKAERVFQNELTTLLNRDAHLKNFLYFRTAGAEAMIVDWQFWGLGIGTFDLRHLLGSALSPELRVHQEELVWHYYDAYRDGLDVDYSWADCWADYCKGIIDNLFMPVWQYTGFGWGFDRWGKSQDSAVENYNVLDCGEIGM